MAGLIGSIISCVREVIGFAPPKSPLSRAQLDEQGAFLAAIIAKIDDDGPRLMYADWLDVQGGASRRARAEFIRIQCENRRSVGNADLQADRGGRDVELFRLWGKHWEAEYLEFVGPVARQGNGGWWQVVDSCLWERGFPASLAAKTSPYPVADLAANCTPFLRHLTVRMHHPICLQRFKMVAGGALRNLRELVVIGEVWDCTIAALVEPPTCPPLQALTLRNGALSESGLRGLFGSPCAPTLKKLTFWNCELGDDSVTLLAGSALLHGLRELNLIDNPITDVGAIALANSPCLPHLRRLCIGDSQEQAAAGGQQLGVQGREALRQSKAFAEGFEVSFQHSE